ncbi:MAG: DUF4920 domain-containing protein [Rubrivivax sp.]|nr:DUF4920 domain-containing protein [Pyrinomonadaceae bacterium]
MKTFFAAALFVGCLALFSGAQDKPHGAHKPAEGAKPAESAATASSADIIKRGAPLGDSPQVKFADAIKEPQKYAGKTIRIEGVIRRVCKMEGCWMEIAPDAESETVRVTFKDHGFFVPKDGDGLKFRAEGELKLKTLSKEEVDHLVKEDGAKVKTNADGTANELSFVATGVELWK